jgi:hypothetical protein
VDGLQTLVVWHVAQSVGNPVWLGLTTAAASGRWQPEHWRGVPAYTPFWWHCVHATEGCAPVSGKLVRLWSNVDGFQTAVVWHVAQSLENPEWLGLTTAAACC